MKLYKALVVFFMIYFIQMKEASFQDKRDQQVSKAKMFLTAWNNYNQEIMQRNLQKRYLNIDFLALYRINLVRTYGKGK